MRYAVGLWLALVALLCTIGATAAADESELYRTTVFVTGRGDAERARGTGLAFEEVLVKVSGDPRLARDPRLADMAKAAGALVVSYDYRDRMHGLALHDEQGTRDRPHDLTVHFDPAKIDAALTSLGSAPWTGPRPRLAVFLAIQDQQTRYVLARDGARGLSQRQALATVAAKRALPMVLPKEALLDTDRLTYDALAANVPPALAPAAKMAGGDAALSGTLIWTESMLGWTASWRMAVQGKDHRWGVSGVSFDDAFRNAIDGALEILSDHGAPN
ncbi:MAG TPA: DUF2066 domain-containing protein [Stellaceae bacterium]|nr:DUF2066 domain-containing protein [Stellaceae bacterium]